MFKTEHLEGRLLYETEKVVCFNIHASINIEPSRPFLVQCLLSLVNYTSSFHPVSFDYEIGGNTYHFTEENFKEEIEEGIKSYVKTRKDLGIDSELN